VLAQTNALGYKAHTDMPTNVSTRMKLKRDARTLKAKALCSLRRAVTAFNGCDEDGRTTTVLLHLQHASEMLLKAILVQKGVRVMDPAKRTSIGHEKCVALAMHHAKLTADEAGLLRTVDALRDAEQHWMGVVPRTSSICTPEAS